MKLSLWYPAFPYKVTQAWGIFNPAYIRFKFSKHNGVDFLLGADSKLLAPMPGKIIKVGNQPTGGGIYVGIISREEYDEWDALLPQAKCRVVIDFLHCEKILVKEGDIVNIGDTIAIADHTGFSTGPHTHMQPRRVRAWNGQVGENRFFELVDSNEANESFDPTPYWNGFAAKDYGKVTGIYRRLIELYQIMISKI